MPLRNAKGRVSLNTGGVSGALKSVRPWLAVFLPAGRCIELGQRSTSCPVVDRAFSGGLYG